LLPHSRFDGAGLWLPYSELLFEGETSVGVVAGKDRTAYGDSMGNQLGMTRPADRRKDPVRQSNADEPPLDERLQIYQPKGRYCNQTER
jgi:hypothetical protein